VMWKFGYSRKAKFPAAPMLAAAFIVEMAWGPLFVP